MLTFREVQSCEGYYYSPRTGAVLRNVGPGETRCWSEGSWTKIDTSAELDVPQYELLTVDVMQPLAAVLREAARRFGSAPSGRVVNRQTAVQPGGEVVTEEAEIRPAGPADAGRE